MSEAGRGNPSHSVRLPHLHTPSVRSRRHVGRNGCRRKTSKGREWQGESQEEKEGKRVGVRVKMDKTNEKRKGVQEYVIEMEMREGKKDRQER